ncbi:HEPN domain-containing protein [Thermus islandicus]|uniref:HEPN domain-containing protein n=1 Tax=Thermus islandicus TaxID=540988 RepID=UPI0003B40679|nr:HEPN domain-containing protein [Thermus islandicus]
MTPGLARYLEEALYLFGSHARGTADRRSDLDLLMVARTSLPLSASASSWSSSRMPPSPWRPSSSPPRRSKSAGTSPSSKGCYGRRNRFMSVEKRRLEARRWLAQAWDDWEAAKALLERGKHAQAAFLAQQAGEKALIALGLDPWGHSLTRLLQDLPPEEAKKALEDAQAILKAVGGRLEKG